MKLVIAEKPSVARSIATVIRATDQQEGYLQGSGYIVSWCIGHREHRSSQGKIRPVAQISPSGSFAPLVSLVGVATPNPPMTGAERRCCGAAVPKNFIILHSPGDCIFAISPGFPYAILHFRHIYGLLFIFFVY